MSYELHQWTAQEPPSNFADQTVAAILRAEERAPRGRKKRRWLVPCALAALLIGSGAWAMVADHVVGDAEAPPPEEQAVIDAPLAPSPAQPSRIVAGQPLLDPPEEETPPPPVPVAIPRPVVPAPAAPPEEPAPDAGTVTMFPRCECRHGAYMCSCVE